MNKLTEVERDLYSLTTEGTHEEIGRQFGSALSGEIAAQVARSIARLMERHEPARIETIIETVGGNFQHDYPYLWDEIGGICSGSGVALKDYLTHLFISAVPVFESDDNDGCTDVLFPKSADGPLLGKTHDATSPNRGQAVVRSINPSGGQAVLCLSGVDGLSTMTGVNAKGLAVGEASIHFHTSNRRGTVRNLLPRSILQECTNVREAVDFLADHPPLRFGYHFALVDEAGDSAIVERSPAFQSVRWGDGGILFCTNHTATPATRALEKSRGELGDRNSDTRFENLKAITTDSQFSPSLRTMKEVLQFHHEVAGICQHGDPEYAGPKVEFYPMFTQRAFINVVETRSLLIANGYPCTSEFIDFSLDQEL
ncbi:MAG: hypothetical protein JSW54_06150 [Fidelibacterota bacterium]|nr:MAG: hypothetical protein JSW54_06150 [Candidatus Neomarinimicrobiota bacterium]